MQRNHRIIWRKNCCDSELNKGTEISFHLFLESAKDQESDQVKLITKFKEKIIKVAIVDDDLVVTAILKKLFSEVNFQVFTFNTSEKITEFLATENVDLILTDLQIANVSGEDLIMKIRDMKNKNSEVPVIVITGDANRNNRSLEKLKVSEMIIKPIGREELYSKVLKILE